MARLDPGLKDALLENTAQLPPTVRDLVAKLPKPAPTRKQSLQQNIDSAKRAYQELLEEMKAIQSKIEAEQQALTATSASYMSLVNSAKPDLEVLPEADAGHPIPAAVAGFINTLGVNSTEEQHQQLQTMLKRPPTASDEEAKGRKTETSVDMDFIHL